MRAIWIYLYKFENIFLNMCNSQNTKFQPVQAGYLAKCIYRYYNYILLLPESPSMYFHSFLGSETSKDDWNRAMRSSSVHTNLSAFQQYLIAQYSFFYCLNMV